MGILWMGKLLDFIRILPEYFVYLQAAKQLK